MSGFCRALATLVILVIFVAITEAIVIYFGYPVTGTWPFFMQGYWAALIVESIRSKWPEIFA